MQRFLFSHNLKPILFLTVLLSKWNPSHTANITSYLQIPALGRSAELGYLYDARTEEFREFVFKEPIKPEFITSLETPYTFTEINYANTIAEKYNLFDIKAEVTISILFGLFTVKGSAKYLTEDKKSARHAQGLMVLKSRTISQSLQIYYDSLKQSYNTALLDHQGATHVVTGIQWGANVAISFTDTFQESKSKQETSGSLAIAFDKLKALFSVSGEAGINVIGNDTALASGFSMKIHGDISLPTEFPRTFKEIQELIKRIPESIGKSNGGKGVQLEYTLTPISQLKDFLKLEIQQNNFFNKLDEAQDKKIIELFEEISLMEQTLYDLQKDFSSYSICTLPQTKSKINALNNDFQRSKIILKNNMKITTVGIRKGELPPAAIVQVFDSYTNDEFNPVNMEIKLKDFKQAIDKISLYKTFRDSFPNIEYIGHEGSLRNTILGNQGKIIYIMYMKPEFTKNYLNVWHENSNAFLNNLYQPFNKLIIVDCDFHSEDCGSLNQTTIKQVQNGQIANENVFKELNLPSESLKSLEIKALGRFAKLGELYDAKTDAFLDESALVPDFPSSVIIPTKSEDSETYVMRSETFQEKCKALGVDSEQQFSILSELFDLRKSGQYLKESYDVPKNLGIGCKGAKSIIHSQLTDEEAINIQDPNFPASLAVNNLMKSPATHFVSTIHYGFNSIFSIQFPSSFQQNLELCTSRYLDSNARILRQVLIQSGSSSAPNFDSLINTSKNETKSMKPPTVIQMEDLKKLDPNIRIKVFSDIQNKDNNPEVIDGVDQLLRYFNQKFFIQQAEQSKGRPISYILSPLDNLRNSHGILKPKAVFKSITSTNRLNPIGFFDLKQKIVKASNKISWFSSEIISNPNCPTDKDFSDLEEIENNFKYKFGNFTREFKDIIIKVKSGEVGIDSLENFKKKYENINAFGKDGRYLQLEKLIPLESKLQFCKEGQMVQYLGRVGTVNQIITKLRGTSSLIYMLFYKPEWTTDKAMAGIWLNRFQTFLGSLGNDESTSIKKLIVDCDFNHLQCEQVKEPTIYKYEDGKFNEVQTSLEGGVTVEKHSESALKDLYENLKKRIDSIEKSYETLQARIQTSKD